MRREQSEGSKRYRSVIIVGAGLGGIGLAVLLKQAGMTDFVILERADDIGGVWRDNTYPGAACDIPAVLYSYSFERDYPWSCSYPPQAEILEYIRHVVRKYGLEPHLRLGRAVVGAEFCDTDQRWDVRTSGGESFTADIFVPAVGIFNEPVIPSIPGAEAFSGAAFHSTAWPKDIAFAAATVAVIGTGASAIQILPELAREGAKVTLFQRTAPYVMPKPPADLDRPEEERERIFREFEAVAERRFDRVATQAARDAFLNRLENEVHDPQLRAALTPDFTLGCKRSVFSNEWYTILQRPNVRVVTGAIGRIEPGGILMHDGAFHRADTIVYATGFNPSSYLPGIAVRGRVGVRLHDVWADGAEAHLGICVAGFPNMFMIFGPNTNVPGSVLFMLECQANYIVDALRRMDALSLSALEVREDVMRRYCDRLQTEIALSTQAAGNCQSYYMNAAGKVVTNYPGSQRRYRKLTESLDLSEYQMPAVDRPANAVAR